MLALFTTTIFLSAALLFIIEPLFARMVLPLLGGSPSVWNTVMLFYQAALLAGYAYAHALSRKGFRWQIAHLALLMSAFLLFLPAHFPTDLVPPAKGNPIVWLLALMGMTIGLPFLLVSTTAPLLQNWFARTRDRRASDPYFLYAASNAGSMLGLLAYPFGLEPHFTLTQQSWFWTFGYGALVLLVACCALASRRGPGPSRPDENPEDPPTLLPTVSWRRRLHWVALAFAPSSLMLGVTTHLSMDIVAIPLFWIVPLAVYLLTFMLAFARRSMMSPTLQLRLLIFAALGALMLLESRVEGPLWLLITMHLTVLFAAGMMCHGTLAGSRPRVGALTEFYLWVATGGALGGVFNAVLAPLWFHSVAEYPLVLVLACVLAPPVLVRATADHSLESRSGVSRRDILVAGLFVAGVAALILGARLQGHEWRRAEFIVLLAALSLPLYALRRRPPRFGLALGGIMLLAPLAVNRHGETLHAERSFFGIHRVVTRRTPTGVQHQLWHGNTIHGLEWADPSRSNEPLGYYHPQGPVGQVFETLGRPPRTENVAIAGLGSGGLSAYARPGQHWTYFEIDPSVVRIASNPAWFCYLARAVTPPRIRLGDARLSLAADSAHYDLLVIDAYTSDAIPLHLLTCESFRIYRRRLAPHGVLVVHLSNRYFDLVPIVRAIAADAGMICRVREDRHSTKEERERGRFPSSWAILGRGERDLGALGRDPRWEALPGSKQTPLWTDDFASVTAALR
jgi:hypothetical protein